MLELTYSTDEHPTTISRKLECLSGAIHSGCFEDAMGHLFDIMAYLTQVGGLEGHFNEWSCSLASSLCRDYGQQLQQINHTLATADTEALSASQVSLTFAAAKQLGAAMEEMQAAADKTPGDHYHMLAEQYAHIARLMAAVETAESLNRQLAMEYAALQSKYNQVSEALRQAEIENMGEDA
jgi:hypothetical protein